MTTFLEVPGVRIVRPLSRAPHSESLLVRVGGEPGAVSAVLARALDERGARLRRIELLALDRGRGPGVVTVLDVLADEAAPALLLTRPRGPRLSEVIGERGSWQAGEVVGVLEPLVATVVRLHDAGVAHGALGASRVVLTEEGPVLIDFGHAELFAAAAPEAVRAGVAAVGRDRDAVRALAVELLAGVAGARSAAAAELARRLAVLPAHEVCREALTGVRELAAPVPLVPEPVVARDEDGPPPSIRIESEGQPGEPSARAVVASEESVGHAPAGLLARGRELVARARAALDGLPPTRRRLLLGGGVAVAALTIGVLTMPGEGRRDAGAAGPTVSAAPTAHPEPVTDDPLEALGLLIAHREECFRESSLLCLDEVDQQGSAALAADRAALLAQRSGGEGVRVAVDADTAVIVERLGDSVLVEAGPETDPASILLMRTEAGSRIRDWIAGEPVG
ncbi:hypothetical protein [Protaetiibacter larvae]|uniref:Protein kinase domain-containing protein n=1 Tax=Protaetiibacter larvae TaxID=2592654 RepID=A0A5C1Y8V6_9MICO|nr:hypothetical protein [Protaetiibacter larvae]QEO10196.1 hypothetical protein FLP23_09350 [Protaetiibacter larvae]